MIEMANIQTNATNAVLQSVDRATQVMAHLASIAMQIASPTTAPPAATAAPTPAAAPPTAGDLMVDDPEMTAAPMDDVLEEPML